MQNKEKQSNKNTNAAIKHAVRCAIYARCARDGSTEGSNSIAEQIRTCTEYAQKQGWEVAADFVQIDVAASAFSLAERKSFAHLLEAATRKPRPFDCVLVPDISRVDKSAECIVGFLRAFRDLGVFIQAVCPGFDSRMLLATLDEEFIDLLTSI